MHPNTNLLIGMRFPHCPLKVYSPTSLHHSGHFDLASPLLHIGPPCIFALQIQYVNTAQIGLSSLEKKIPIYSNFLAEQGLKHLGMA